MPTPEISIVIPTQGRRASLREALASALAQDFESCEVVIVDDSVGGSSWRGRPDLAAMLPDPRVRIVDFHQSRGCAAAKNAGLAAARGRWVCYLDDDNRYLPAKIRRQHALAVGHDQPLVLCGLEIRVAQRRRIRQVQTSRFEGDELLLATVPDTNVLFHRRDCGVWWNATLETVDDACFFHAILEQHHLRSVLNVPEPLVIYESHAGVRANRARSRLYRGQRALLLQASRRYSPRARRIALLRALLAFEKFRPGRWARLVRLSAGLVRAGGLAEWRAVANAAGAKLPLVRRWMVT